DNPALFDQSSETFSVPEQSTEFFVNDASVVGDVFTTAPGSNRNTGRTADSPKPSPRQILNQYSLGPGDVLKVDTGEYSLLGPILLSGVLGIGDDEGFLLTGPDPPADATLRLYPVVSDNPLLHLVDADAVTIKNLGLVDAQNGILLSSGTTDVVLENLLVTGHSGDGIHGESGTSVTSLTNIQSNDNSGDGIEIAGVGSGVLNVVALRNGQSGLVVNGDVGVIEGLDASQNGGNGLRVTGAISRLSQWTANGNGLRGAHLNGSPGILVETGSASGNQSDGLYVFADNATVRSSEFADNGGYGIHVYGDNALIGHADLTAGLGNILSSNQGGGIRSRQDAMVVGNHLAGHRYSGTFGIELYRGTAIHNVIADGRVGILADDSVVSENRIYYHASTGIESTGATQIVGNTIYSVPTGILAMDAVVATNNVIYDNATVGIKLSGADASRLENNTLYQTSGSGVILNASTDVVLRNNIVSVVDGNAVEVSTVSQPGFDSDFNQFEVTGTGNIGRWAGIPVPDLGGWQIVSFGDKNSFVGSPQFVDVLGSDAMLGYVDSLHDGRDDDFHLKSNVGRFTGSLSPVVDAVTNLPVFLASAEFVDSVQSAAIDRGDQASDFANEPANNGGYVNLGAYGNTTQASKSPADFLFVFTPNGGEVFPATKDVDITWRTALLGGGTMVDIALVRDSDPLYSLPLV
uniref:right-handed parallel beta-helix repeat-containing protein n=1 Tax=Stieleria sp. TaxID=2795976 RepID=UPI00356593B4